MSAASAPALPQTCCPTIWMWPGHAMYAGPGLGLAAHSGSVWCLVVGVDEPVTVVAAGATTVARRVLVPPRLLHQLSTRGAIVSCYFEPGSARSESCRRQFGDTDGAVGRDHANERVLTVLPHDDAAAGRWLDLGAPEAEHRLDSRIEAATKQIRDDPAATARTLAAAAGLSESRFLHVFRQETGTSLRRYRMWSMLMAAGASMAAGLNLTSAAADAGFASPSHLSDRFKSTFGLSATKLFASGVAIRTPTGL